MCLCYTEHMIFLHIVIAFASLGLAGLLLAKPSQSLIKINVGLIGATVTTGAVLAVQGYSILHLCTAGLIYTTIAAGLTLAARKRLLARQAL